MGAVSNKAQKHAEVRTEVTKRMDIFLRKKTSRVAFGKGRVYKMIIYLSNALSFPLDVFAGVGVGGLLGWGLGIPRGYRLRGRAVRVPGMQELLRLRPKSPFGGAHEFRMSPLGRLRSTR